ncbi:TPA: N-acetyltransferase [Vibrio harveyi]|nr:N-acetyltransferase [Vibrio harveyi]
MQIRRWLELLQEEGEDKWASCNMTADGWELLLRCQTNDVPGRCMVIGTVRLKEEFQGRGYFKSLLNYLSEISPWSTIVIEQIENEQLTTFCQKYHFQPVSHRYTDSFWINKETLPKFDVQELQ